MPQQALAGAPQSPSISENLQNQRLGGQQKRKSPIPASQVTASKVLSWAELEVMGKTKPAPPQPPKPGDLSTIMYTSGTTGE